MKKLLFILVCIACVSTIAAQEKNLVLQHGALKVSDDRRFLVHEDGTPFFWLGDTGWELFHRLNKEEATKYLTKRASQGYTVIQAVVLAEFDGLHTPNPYGETPLENDDPTKPRESYFTYVDWIIDKAAELGLYIGLLPTWGDKLFKDRWGAGPEIFTVENAKIYGRWIGNRYRNKKNIVWIIGGDRNPRNEGDVNVWRAMANGIIEGVGNNDKALMTFHPQPGTFSSSSPWFHNDEWLDFNMLQTGHCNDTKVWEKIASDYNKESVKPTINGEAVYEEHPLCFNAKEKGYTSAHDGRKAAWLSVFAGGFGYTYGCHSIWQFYKPDSPGVNGPLRYWYVSMDLPAARQMTHLRKLIERFPATGRVPSQHLLKDTLDAGRRIQATSGKDYIMVYTSSGEPFRLQLGSIRSKSMKSYWFDPRTGAMINTGVLKNEGVKTFKPLSAGDDNDWVLVLYDSSKKYLPD